VYGYDGTTSGGYNITSSEMGHLYYTELGNLGFYDTGGNFQPGKGLTNTGPFTNLQPNPYWSDELYDLDNYNAWGFNFGGGSQFVSIKGLAIYGLAVRPGDVAAASVPEPGTLMLMGSGLVGLIAARKRFSRRHR
jgi:hypothetical protein